MPSKFYPGVEEQTKREIPNAILVFGAFGHRKTTTALTASKLFPKLPEALPFKNPVHLADTLILKWDRQALIGLPKLGVSVPSFDLNGINPKDLLDALGDIHADVDDRVRNKGTRLIIHDTISAFDTKVLVNCRQNFVRKPEAGKAPDKNQTQMMYNALLAIHVQEFAFYTGLRCPDGTLVQHIFNCHSTYKGDLPTTDETAIRKGNLANQAKGLNTEGGGAITARITGQAWNMYYEQCPLRIYIHVKEVNGKETGSFYTDGGQNSVSADRGGVLAPVEAADFRSVFAKYGVV